MTDHWQTKLAAWTHDPAEKALVLLRDPAGHEGGTVKMLRAALRLGDIDEAILKRADHWASAADRPQFPRERDKGPYQQWTQVNFADKAELKHPLSGESYDLGKLNIDPQQIKTVSTDHFNALIHTDTEGAVDYQRTALAFWRYGPQSPAPELNKLWELLPADTRVPDHSIWAHLDLTSAFATASVLDAHQTPALLTVSFGPVQSFIAQARSTSDLWAGSHLLSRIAWEGLKVICEQLGPDAVIFPQLRGIPQVDLWLCTDKKLCEVLFQNEEWTYSKTDSNPLFAAALPNKFVAIVPADQVQALAEGITSAVRGCVMRTAEAMLADLLKTAGEPDPERQLPCWQQLRKQLAGFPEVHWASVSWSLIDDGLPPATTQLDNALRLFYPAGTGALGFLGSAAWKLLKQELSVEGFSFYRPNAGTLYPALYDLLERLGAASKSVREFQQTEQHGYRDSLSGEAEWLTTKREQLAWTPRQRKDNGTLWTKAADRGRFGIRKGEHLSALGLLKRLWPSFFVREMKNVLDTDMQRYVVSTHTMALATTFEQWLKNPDHRYPDLNDLSELKVFSQLCGLDSAALPRKLALKLDSSAFESDERAQLLLRKLPTYLDTLRDREDKEDDEALRQAETFCKEIFSSKPETYYALLLMDGDKMGAWLSGEERFTLHYRAAWHSKIVNGLAQRDRGDLKNYLDASRPVSPARHMAISGALNSFSLHVVQYIVEELYKGKLFYAGGDDVMAMVSVDDLLPLMTTLRLAYSGMAPDSSMSGLLGDFQKLALDRGHALLRNRLYRMMGANATASTGAVIAHHTAPLSAVLRELRAAEKCAKNEGGRDAFSITLRKRSGGAIRYTSRWFGENGAPAPIALLLELKQALSDPAFSRRVVYIAQDWLPQLPEPEHFADLRSYQDMLEQTLSYQFKRQNKGRDTYRPLAVKLAAHAAIKHEKAIAYLQDCIATAEFLARESRSGQPQGEA